MKVQTACLAVSCTTQRGTLGTDVAVVVVVVRGAATAQVIVPYQTPISPIHFLTHGS